MQDNDKEDLKDPFFKDGHFFFFFYVGAAILNVASSGK